MINIVIYVHDERDNKKYLLFENQGQSPNLLFFNIIKSYYSEYPMSNSHCFARVSIELIF